MFLIKTTSNSEVVRYSLRFEYCSFTVEKEITFYYEIKITYERFYYLYNRTGKIREGAMSNNEVIKLNVYENVLKFLEENRDITCNVRAFSWSIARFQRVVEELRKKEREFADEVLEKSILVSNAKDEMIMSLFAIQSSLIKFVREVKDENLKHRVKGTQTQFFRMSETELIEKASAIQLLAVINLPKLRKYGMTPNMTHDLKNKIECLKQALDNKVMVYYSSSNLITMNSLFTEADKIMTNYIDGFVESLGEDFPEFYSDYSMAKVYQHNLKAVNS